MNKVILMGNLTRDPELKILPSGTSVANFGIATNERWKDSQTGEDRENVTYVDVETWNGQSEVINKYFKKGSPILIEGALKYESWDAEDGTKRNRLKVRMQRFEFVGSRSDNGNTSDSPETADPTPTADDQTQTTNEGAAA
ncbi:single-stranded DNA-binding protein [Candidatus Poribacteria bacterium]|nr:single-stranded DNA-binding protein [Candidatus Poribacteria bacterium]